MQQLEDTTPEKERERERRKRNKQMTKKTFLTFVVEHLAGVESKIGGAEGHVTASVDIPLLISRVGLALEAGSVDEVGGGLDTTNARVNIDTGHLLSSVVQPQTFG